MKKLIFLLIVIGFGCMGCQKTAWEDDQRLEPMYELPYVLVYGSDHCGYTRKCVDHFEEEGLDMIYEDFNDSQVKEEALERAQEAGFDPRRLAIPIIDVNGKIIIGCRDPEEIAALYHESLAQ